MYTHSQSLPPAKEGRSDYTVMHEAAPGVDLWAVTTLSGSGLHI